MLAYRSLFRDGSRSTGRHKSWFFCNIGCRLMSALGIISGHGAPPRDVRFTPESGHQAIGLAMSAKGHKRTFAIHSITSYHRIWHRCSRPPHPKNLPK